MAAIEEAPNRPARHPLARSAQTVQAEVTRGLGDKRRPVAVAVRVGSPLARRSVATPLRLSFLDIIMKRRRDIPVGWMALAAALGFGGVFVAMSPAAALTVRGLIGPLAGCVVKGNISINSGERIYHVPGQHYYDETVIRYEFGERYFCSEADARAAGWRRSGI